MLSSDRIYTHHLHVLRPTDVVIISSTDHFYFLIFVLGQCHPRNTMGMNVEVLHSAQKQNGNPRDGWPGKLHSRATPPRDST